jgi:hypothetical protein
MSSRHEIMITDEERVIEIIDSMLAEHACSLRYNGCSGYGELVEDPYESDVNNTPGVMIMACARCLEELCDDI